MEGARHVRLLEPVAEEHGARPAAVAEHVRISSALFIAVALRVHQKRP